MSNKRIDLKYYENKYTFETPIDPNWNGAPWTAADLKVILDELNRCYELIDELENPSHEDERYPEPDELTPPNSSRAGADWPSGPRM
tara:strand:- start:467 stop:727 length:261 start_codon:yes stop_codon:yes gene_type:complete